MKMLRKSNEAGRQVAERGGGERGKVEVEKTLRGYLSRIFNMSSCSLAQFNLSLVCLFFGASLSLPHSLSSLPSLSHILLLFVCKIMKASPAKPLTRKTLSNLISIISKEQPPVPSTPSSPKYLKITTYSFSLSLSPSIPHSALVCLSRSVCCCCYPNTVAIRNVCSAVPLYP